MPWPPLLRLRPAGRYTDYHDVYTHLEEMFTVTRVLALTALEATT